MSLNHFRPEQIVGCFLQGSQNYGLDYEGSDIDTKLIVVPSFADICLNRKPISTTYVRENNEHTDWKDIRLYMETFRKQNLNFLEILFTEFYIINPMYKEEWMRLVANRERIARMNPFRAVKSMKGIAHEKYAAMEKPYPSKIDLIEKYGADGVRMGMMLSAPAGNDILFDDALCEQGRNFNNKIWNAFRLVKGWEVADIEQPAYAALATEWFESMLAKTAAEVDDLFSKYRLSEALMAVYKLFWDEFSSWYLEMVKPAYIDGKAQPMDKKTYEKTLSFFDSLLKLLHPFMPFITEELWQHIYDRQEGESLMVQLVNINKECNEEIVKNFEAVKEVIGGIRTIRLQKNIAQKEALSLQVVGESPVVAFNSVIAKLCNLTAIESVEAKAEGSASFMVGTTEYAVPLGNLINVEEELKKLEADLKYNEGFLQSVLKKLSNEKFVSKAPANVIEMERKKQADAESKIASLKESIAALKK